MSKDYTKHTATNNWSAAIYKRENDQRNIALMADFIFARKDQTIRTIELAGTTMAFSEQLAQAFPNNRFECLGIECNAGTHAIVTRKAAALCGEYPNATFRVHPRCTLSEFLNSCTADTGQFACIYPDYMGVFNPQHIEDISTIFRRKLLIDGGFLITTSMYCRNSTLEQPNLIKILLERNYLQERKLEAERESGELNFKCKTFAIPLRIEQLGNTLGHRVVSLRAQPYLSPTKMGKRKKEMSYVWKCSAVAQHRASEVSG